MAKRSTSASGRRRSGCGTCAPMMSSRTTVVVGASVSSAETKAIKDRNERILNKRYPWYSRWAAWSSNDAFSPLAQALGSAQRALQGMIVAIDATCLGD